EKRSRPAANHHNKNRNRPCYHGGTPRGTKLRHHNAKPNGRWNPALLASYSHGCHCRTIYEIACSVRRKLLKPWRADSEIHINKTTEFAVAFASRISEHDHA